MALRPQARIGVPPTSSTLRGWSLLFGNVLFRGTHDTLPSADAA
jgi:hypothetical protein